MGVLNASNITSNTEVVVAPPSVYLHGVSQKLRGDVKVLKSSTWVRDVVACPLVVFWTGRLCRFSVFSRELLDDHGGQYLFRDDSCLYRLQHYGLRRYLFRLTFVCVFVFSERQALERFRCLQQQRRYVRTRSATPTPLNHGTPSPCLREVRIIVAGRPGNLLGTLVAY